MTRKGRRLTFVALGMLALGAAAALVLTAFEENLVFFLSPTEILAQKTPPGRVVRLGGLVVEGSVKKRSDGGSVAFAVTDLANSVTVAYLGILPDLFREGQGIVIEGMVGPDGVFRATEVLAKHDETYMPREIAETLKKSGRSKGTKAP